MTNHSDSSSIAETPNPQADQPIPAARPLTDYSFEHMGSDLVLFDESLMHYHTLNASAASIWRACDGHSSIREIAIRLHYPVEVVECTVAELGDAALLQGTMAARPSVMSRRTAAKLIAAGAIGAAGAPLVASITVPESASAATPCVICPPGSPHAGECKGGPQSACSGGGNCCSNICIRGVCL